MGRFRRAPIYESTINSASWDNLTSQHWSLKIDIICFDDLIINDDYLNIPHPNLHKRPFVFLPLRDLDKSWKHPIFLKTIDEFVKEFDPNELKSVKKIL